MNLQEQISRMKSMMGLLTEEIKNNYTFNVKFKGGYYKNNEDNFGELNKNLDDFLTQLKTDKNKKLLSVYISAGESTLPNTDNELGGKAVEPGYLSKKRFETIKTFIEKKINTLKKTLPNLSNLTFIPSGEPVVGKDIIIAKSKTTFIGQDFCPVNKIDKVNDPQGFACLKQNFDPGNGKKNWKTGRDTDYAVQKKNYNDDQYIEIRLYLTNVVSVNQNDLNSIKKIKTASSRESIATYNPQLMNFFYQYSIPAALASNKDYKKLPGQLLTMNAYFSLLTDNSNDSPLFCPPTRYDIIPNGGEQVQLIIPNESDGQLTDKKWTAKIANSYTLKITPEYKPGTKEYKGQWLFAALYMINSTKTTTNDWEYISNKPKDIDYSLIYQIENPKNPIPEQADPTAQYNFISTINGGKNFSGYIDILKKNGLYKEQKVIAKK